MDTILVLLLLASFIFLIIGIFSPKTSLFWDKQNATRKKSALTYAGLTVLFFVLFAVWNNQMKSDKKGDSASYDIEKPKAEIKNTDVKETRRTKIEELERKQEMRADGEFNQMTLFVVDGSITIDELISFCSKNKSDYTDGYLQYLVFFTDRASARFPDNPISAQFMEDRDLERIKAIYALNNFNGYSKLSYYEKNAFVSLSTSVDIQ
jgi:hypothetical protein